MVFRGVVIEPGVVNANGTVYEPDALKMALSQITPPTVKESREAVRQKTRTAFLKNRSHAPSIHVREAEIVGVGARDNSVYRAIMEDQQTANRLLEKPEETIYLVTEERDHSYRMRRSITEALYLRCNMPFTQDTARNLAFPREGQTQVPALLRHGKDIFQVSWRHGEYGCQLILKRRGAEDYRIVTIKSRGAMDTLLDRCSAITQQYGINSYHGSIGDSNCQGDNLHLGSKGLSMPSMAPVHLQISNPKPLPQITEISLVLDEFGQVIFETG